MRAEWQAFHDRLERQSRTRPFQEEFRKMCEQDPGLAARSEPGALLAVLHGPGDARSKNRVLRSLVAIAQGGDSPRSVAQITLLLALWPGLDAIYRRCLWRFRCDPAGLATDLLGGVTAGIHKLRLDRVEWIAATLLRNAERDLRRAEIADRKRQMTAREITDEVIHAEADPTAPADVACVADDPRASTIMRHLAALPPGDAALLLAVAVLGETQHEAAERLGITHDAARKRYQRALARLRVSLGGE